MIKNDVWNPCLTILAGFVLGVAFWGTVIASQASIDASDWLQFSGSIIGSIVGLVGTLIGAWIAWNAVQRQIERQQYIADELRRRAVAISRQFSRDILDILAVFDDRLKRTLSIIESSVTAKIQAGQPRNIIDDYKNHVFRVDIESFIVEMNRSLIIEDDFKYYLTQINPEFSSRARLLLVALRDFRLELGKLECDSWMKINQKIRTLDRAAKSYLQETLNSADAPIAAPL